MHAKQAGGKDNKNLPQATQPHSEAAQPTGCGHGGPEGGGRVPLPACFKTKGKDEKIH